MQVSGVQHQPSVGVQSLVRVEDDNTHLAATQYAQLVPDKRIVQCQYAVRLGLRENTRGGTTRVDKEERECDDGAVVCA